MQVGDWVPVRSIYVEGLATGDATFETEAPSWKTWDEGHLSVPRLVAVSETDGTVLGWAALSRVSPRAVYAGVGEVSVYVAANSRSLGIGQDLLEQLVVQSEHNGIWTLQASVFPENKASLAVHKICGFREVGIRQKIGRMNGIWRDTVLLERRSALVGSD
ncbi:MAG TPA: GNAT family N-acetyltransferase [Pyrinomonadaceae bacterium]|nr:GNAT family N-acetyltransferase [Pyrinomonadaceae bacterium]